MRFYQLSKPLLIILSFILAYCFHYAAIAIFAKGGIYWEFGAEHLNYIQWFRSFQLNTADTFLNYLGFETYFKNETTLAFKNGSGIVLVYGCLGIEVISLWCIYIFFSESPSNTRKIKWALAGSVAILVLNIIRIIILLIAFNKKWLGDDFDHHSFYNFLLYIIIILFIVLHQRNEARFI